MPDIKQQLIAILDEPGPVGDYDFHQLTIRPVLENLRCDRCKHWRSSGATDWRTHNPTGNCFYLDQITHADFFCAAWEAKSA